MSKTLKRARGGWPPHGHGKNGGKLAKEITATPPPLRQMTFVPWANLWRAKMACSGREKGTHPVFKIDEGKCLGITGRVWAVKRRSGADFPWRPTFPGAGIMEGGRGAWYTGW